MKTKTLYLLTIIFIGAFPFGNTFYKVFRGLSVSFFHTFSKTAPFAVHLPPLFEKYIHFYLTDFWIVALLTFAFALKEVRAKELFLNRHSQFLTFYSLVATFSIAFSLFASYPYQYVTLINLTLSFAAFHLIYHLMSKKTEWISKALWLFAIIAFLECLIGTGQFLFQQCLGLSFLSEPQITPLMDNIATYPLNEKSRLFFDLLPWAPLKGSNILRAYGTFDHPNIFGGYLAIALFVTYYLILTAKAKAQKTFLYLLLPFLILTLFLTFSRGPLFAWILGTILFFSVGIFKKMEGFAKLGAIIGSAFLIAFALLFQQLAARGGVVNYNGISQASDAGRMLFYKLGLAMFFHHPFLGIGYNGFSLFPYEVLDPSFLGANPTGALSHSIYLQVASETGLIGLALMGCFMISLFMKSFKVKTTPLSLTFSAILLSFLLIGVVDHFLWAYNSGRLMLFIFAGLFAAYTKAKERPSFSHEKYGVKLSSV
jgi:hypothetical protein